MIFVTVGTELPFDRMVRMVDAWAAKTGRSDVYAQIGTGHYIPKAGVHARFLDPEAFTKCLERSKVIVSHAGTGSILSALAHSKPLIVIPRMASLGEHRNDHQLATARHLATVARVNVAWDESELFEQLDGVDGVRTGSTIAPFASASLIAAIRDFASGHPTSRSLPASATNPAVQ